MNTNDWETGEWDVFAAAAAAFEVDEREAFIRNAMEELETLRSTITDALTGKNDLMLKVSLLQDVDSVERNLRKALA